MPGFVSLSQNIALVFSLTFVYGLLQPQLERIPWQRQDVLKGLLFGLFALVSMTMPIQIAPGLFSDARTIVLCIAGIYGGTLPVLIATVMVLVTRWVIGGVGVPGAFASIITALLIGVWVRRYHERHGTQPNVPELLGIGAALAIFGSLWSVLLSRIDSAIIWEMFPTTFVIYPASMLLLGMLLASQQHSQVNERALRESERRFHAIFDSAFQFMGLLKPDGTLLEMNQTLFDYQHESREHYNGRRFWEIGWGQVSPEQSNLLHEFVRRAALGETVRHEFTMTNPAGREMALDFSIKPIRDEANQIELLLIEGHDISAVKELERQKLDLMLERERAGLLKSFISDVSHDFRTPLAVMRLNLELLRRGSESPKQQQRIDVVAGQEQHLTRLLTDMLSMLSLDEGQVVFNFKLLDLNFVAQLVCDEHHNLAQRKQQKLSFNHFAEALPVQADQVEIERALDKLLINALSYTPPGGSILVNILKQDGCGIVEISDTGIGIAAEDLPNIFQRGYRADSARSMDTGGTGMGLPIARKIIEIHGGRIDVTSTLEAGSTFRVVIPLSTAEGSAIIASLHDRGTP